MKKRADLQGVRGMAITSVLLYHFFPEIFKNGYVGVDQFFILSGFLMTEILSRESSLSTSGLFSFYYRRMKRILPLYALFIFCTLLFSLLVFPISTFDYNIPHAIRSLAFISNTKQEDSKLTYERMLSDAEVLYTHTWSLSCEVQFYAIAPFLIVMPAFEVKEFVTAVICVTSYFFFTYLWENGSQQFAFNFMFTRIWQFSLGILCSLFLRENNSKNGFEPLISEKEDLDNCFFPNNKEIRLYSNLSNLICFSLMLVCWFPLEISPHFVRLLVCCLTAGLIYSGQIFPNLLLSNRIVVYLGDISYSLYLIHWPIYVYFKQYHMETVIDSILGIVGSIFLASLIHEFYEKFYLRLEKKAIIGLCGALYFACFVILAPNVSFEFGNTVNLLDKGSISEGSEYYVLPKNMTLESTMALNKHFSAVDLDLLYLKECNYTKFREDEQLGWTMCKINNTDFTGSKRLMFVGNSYSPNIARMFIKLKECQEKATEIFMYTRMTCEVLNNACKGNITNRYYEAVKTIKPDILFIGDRHIASMEPPKELIDTNFESEKWYLERIEKEVKDKVYILNALPRPIVTPKYTTTLNEGLRINGRVDHNLITDHSANYKIARTRMAKLAKTCSKCEIIDLMPSFTKNGVFQMYNEDNKVQYFTNPLHLSEYGLQKVSPAYRKLCSSIV